MLYDQKLVKSYLTTSIDLLDREVGFGPKDYNYVDNIPLGPMCAKCMADYPLDEWVPELKSGKDISQCKECNGPIKPRV